MYESGENYLETILLLSKEKQEIRSIDIARKLNYSKPSVCRGVKLLKEAGYITTLSNGMIQLTKLGQEMADSIYERHQILTQFLVQTLDVSLEIAEADACKIEHVISQEVFEGMKKFIKKNPKG